MTAEREPAQGRRSTEGRLQRVPPHDVAAEMALLGAAMHNREVAAVVAALDPGVFYGPSDKATAHPLIADAIRRLVADGVPVDTGTVANVLREDGQLEQIGGTVQGIAKRGPAYLVALLADAYYFDLARAQIDADLLVRLAGKRRILTLAYAVSEGVYAHTDIGGLAAELVASIEGEAAAAISTWDPVNLAGILAGDGGETAPAILRRTDGAMMLYPGRIHSFNAEPESAKTWLALWACLEVVERGGHVLYVDCEDSAVTAVERLLALGADPGQLLDRFHYVRPDEPIDIGVQARVKAATGTWPIEVAVIDGVGEALAMSGWNEDKAADFLAFLTTLVRPLARSGAAVVLIDHVSKNPDERRGYARGTGAKKGSGDVALELQVVKPFGRDRDGLVKVWVRKDRPGHLRGAALEGRLWAEMVVRSADGGASVAIDLRTPSSVDGDSSAGFQPTALMGRVSTWLASNGPATNRAIRDARLGRGQWVDTAVRELVKGGYAAKGPEGISHVRRFDPDIVEEPEEVEQRGTENTF